LIIKEADFQLGYFKYLALYKTKTVNTTVDTLVIDPVQFTIYKDTREYQVPIQQTSVAVKDLRENQTILDSWYLQTDPSLYHIEIVARIKEFKPDFSEKGKVYCENEIDQILTIISMLYGKTLFLDLVYKGWLITDESFLINSTVVGSELVSPNKASIDNTIKLIKKKINKDKDLSNRFTLMSRLFSKSLKEKQGSEELYLWLWTILEVFPMRNTSNIKPISDILSRILNRSLSEVKEKLEIGRLNRVRCDIVHNGRLDIDNKEVYDAFNRLELIVIVILKHLCDLPYNGELDSYFE